MFLRHGWHGPVARGSRAESVDRGLAPLKNLEVDGHPYQPKTKRAL